jgi:hypothetical protein
MTEVTFSVASSTHPQANFKNANLYIYLKRIYLLPSFLPSCACTIFAHAENRNSIVLWFCVKTKAAERKSFTVLFVSFAKIDTHVFREVDWWRSDNNGLEILLLFSFFGTCV